MSILRRLWPSAGKAPLISSPVLVSIPGHVAARLVDLPKEKDFLSAGPAAVDPRKPANPLSVDNPVHVGSMGPSHTGKSQFIAAGTPAAAGSGDPESQINWSSGPSPNTTDQGRGLSRGGSAGREKPYRSI